MSGCVPTDAEGREDCNVLHGVGWFVVLFRFSMPAFFYVLSEGGTRTKRGERSITQLDRNKAGTVVVWWVAIVGVVVPCQCCVI